MQLSFARYLVVSAATIFFCTEIFAQKLAGSITDDSGRAVAYASIFIKETGKGTNANNEGHYTIGLKPGKYTIVCQHVGYTKEERIINVAQEDVILNIMMKLQALTLGEVIVKNGEDPAYQVIRNTISKRKFHGEQWQKFETQVYTKGQLSVRDYPKKIFGQKVDFEDGDTSKKKMIYLSETVSNYRFDKPKEKVEVISSKVSGQSDGFGLAAPGFFSFYENSINIGNNLNPRGFISPISDHALNYYKYKLEGTYFEDGNMINHIRVIPRRKFEPLFSGYIDIVDQDWLIHSLNLLLTKESQMELIDTLRIEQLYRPVSNGVWFISSQVIYPAIKLFGFDAYGSFINIYSDISIQPVFNKKAFDHTILKYLDSANKRSLQYWENVRPVPLMANEELDYRKKDSLEKLRMDPHYQDSLDRKRNRTTITGVVFTGSSFSNTKSRSSISLTPLIEQIRFNPAEGWVVHPEMNWTKRLDSSLAGRHSISITSDIRYGFSNQHFNSYLTVNYGYGKKYPTNINLSGGSRVFQFNNNSPIGEFGNTITCLFSERNRIKSYEARYIRGSFRKGIGEGFGLTVAFQYQDRRPLDNTTDFTFRDKENRAYTPNYPSDLTNHNIERHQAFWTLIGMRWQPGTRYIELADKKISIGSKYPVFTLEYVQAFRNFMNSDVGYAKWRFNVSDDVNLHLLGRLRYRLGMGGFLKIDSVNIPDYNHFNGNVATLASEYLNSFQLLPLYQFSNTSSFYFLGHVEHNFKGFLTNKLPGIKKLNLYLVIGGNGFRFSGTGYLELFAGLDNIFKQIRVDLIQSWLNGKPWSNGIRIGFSMFSRRGREEWP